MNQSKLNKTYKIIVVIIFSAVIFSPFFIGLFQKDKKISGVENRALTKFPKINFTVHDIQKFPKSFDSYYLDHFGLRDWLIKNYKMAKYNLGDSPSNDVTLGKEGWMFLGSIKNNYNNYADPMGDVRNKNLFTENQLKTFAINMSFLNDWLQKKGIKYFFVIAPNKHTIYFDKLPGYITKEKTYSSTDQLVEYLKKNTDISVIDLRKNLLEAKKDNQLYLKTDTHWNHNAANIAQYEIMMEIKKFFKNLIMPELFQIKPKYGRGGDLALFTTGIDSFKELRPQPVFIDNQQPVLILDNPNDYKRFSYSSRTGDLKALIYRDSFFDILVPYFSRKLKYSTYISEKLTYPSLKMQINLKKPDIVIEEWVERTLPYTPTFKQYFENNEVNRHLFIDSNKIIFKDRIRDLIVNEDIKVIRQKKTRLQVVSIGNDPIITFPKLPFKKDKSYIVYIKMNSSVQSTLQLFYSDINETGYPFSEKNSILKAINLGNNEFYILLKKNNLGKNLRLDPISGKGKIKIKAIEIKEVDKNYFNTGDYTQNQIKPKK